ncbi:MAG: IgGFc-binding protein [Polyangiaceae bacterium]
MARRTGRAWLAALAAAASLGACFDSGTRYVDGPPVVPQAVCTVGATRCTNDFERCRDSGGTPAWVAEEACGVNGKVCALELERCTPCLPNSRGCDGIDVVQCDAQGELGAVIEICDPANGDACRNGACLDLCNEAQIEKSNVGCTYWAVDLDNANIDATSNAAAQQFAVVVSNPQPDVPAVVRVFQDNGQPGAAPTPLEIASAVIAPLNLVVLKLGPREVDGSEPGSYDTGTHTALTRHAYKLESDFPVVAYQFNPLENVNVFSNDASLLKPQEAFDNISPGALRSAYVVGGWPQTIAVTDDPNTNFNPNDPINLRAFLTLVGTREATKVRVHTTAAVVGGGPVPATPAGGVIEAELGAFDVLNLETGDFNADFTGTFVEADGPIAAFVGNEASDAPHFETLVDRRCCADHLEDQLDPIRTAGFRFAIPHSPSRTRTVQQAGGDIGVVAEPDFVRFVAVQEAGARIVTTLPEPDNVIDLPGRGAFREVTVMRDFMAESDQPVSVIQVTASQDAAGVKRGLPGGDPSLVVIPPIDQFRASYVFLTPDKYAFDFVCVVAPAAVTVYLDGAPIGPERCAMTPADGRTDGERGGPAELVVYTCQLGFALVDPLEEAPDNVSLGVQNDGVHRLLANGNVGVVVSGFDSYVSYGYAGGTELREIAPPD